MKHLRSTIVAAGLALAVGFSASAFAHGAGPVGGPYWAAQYRNAQMAEYAQIAPQQTMGRSIARQMARMRSNVSNG